MHISQFRQQFHFQLRGDPRRFLLRCHISCEMNLLLFYDFAQLVESMYEIWEDVEEGCLLVVVLDRS